MRTLLILIWIAFLTFGLSTVEARKKKVTLANGQTYEVKTDKDGLPVRFTSDQIIVHHLGIVTMVAEGSDSAQFNYLLSAKLKEEGEFNVTVTSPIDSKISTTFECTGPGEFSEVFFDRADYSTVWRWLDESGISWIPFAFSFEEKLSSKSFEILQWVQFDSDAREAMRHARELAEEIPSELDKSDPLHVEAQEPAPEPTVQTWEFQKVWYTNPEKPPLMKVAQASGDLAVRGDQFTFQSKKITLEIRCRSIRRISWDYMPRDTTGGGWVVVEYEDGESRKVAAFRAKPGFTAQLHANVTGENDDSATTAIFSAITSMAIAAFPEKVRFAFDNRDWKVGFDSRERPPAPSQKPSAADALFITEFVLPGESVERWSELVTVQVAPYLQEQWTAQEYMLGLKEQVVQLCPSVMWNVLQESAKEVLYEWQIIDCPGWDDQYEVSKVIVGELAIHRVAYTTRMLPLAEEKRGEWLAAIREATVEAMAPSENPQ